MAERIFIRSKSRGVDKNGNPTGNSFYQVHPPKRVEYVAEYQHHVLIRCIYPSGAYLTSISKNDLACGIYKIERKKVK